MRAIDCHYSVTDEQLRRYAEVPLVERLRWLEELACFTQMVRSAPHVRRPDGAEPTPPGLLPAASVPDQVEQVR